MNLNKIITIDKEIMGGQPVFSDTRVPIETLFDHLEIVISIDEFLDDFSTVRRDQAVALLDASNKIMTSQNISEFYETIA